MNAQDKKFNNKIIFAALIAVILAILIAYYYSYTQSQSEISFLENEKEILVKDLTLMKADLDRLASRNEVDEIELERSRYQIQQLQDSVGRLNFTVEKLREYKTELRRLEAQNDSLKLKNNFLKYNSSLLADKYENSQKEIAALQEARNQLTKAESLQRQKQKELNEELKKKKYLELDNEQTEGAGLRLRDESAIITTKASIVEKLRGCFTISADTEAKRQEKILYFQFLDPNMRIVEDNANTITVNGNVYSKRVQLLYSGEEMRVCDFITLPKGSLEGGIYTLNVFENDKLLSTTEFRLK
ncbi:hypothetical protein GH721_12970 [Kriegella sp. EG-1]|nr:hypothetical protein [Flavobacteriaceae bacterium EG-1]